MADSNQINTSDATSTDVSVNETNPSVDTKETAAATQPGASNATVSSPEMKNVQDLTRYVWHVILTSMDGDNQLFNACQVELLLQQMQERFQGISDQVLSRNILFIHSSFYSFRLIQY